MSAFEYYANADLSVNKKRKKKKKSRSSVSNKKNRIENQVVDKPKITGYKDLNSIYNLNLKNSTKTGKKLFEWLIHPIDVEDFMK
jgi:hypothetical protein